MDAAIAAAQARYEGTRKAVHETRRQIEADLRANGADYRAAVRAKAAKRRDDALDALADATEALAGYLDAAAVTAALAPVPGTTIGGVLNTDSQRGTRMKDYRGHEAARTLAQVRQQIAAIDLSDEALGHGPDTDTGSGPLRVAGWPPPTSGTGRCARQPATSRAGVSVPYRRSVTPQQKRSVTSPSRSATKEPVSRR